MQKKAIHTSSAPKAIGPYSQAIISHGFIFISGQLPIDPISNLIVSPKIEEQTKQVLANIEAILISQNLHFEHLVKVEIFLKDLADFPLVNQLYSNALTSQSSSLFSFPARHTIEVSRLPLDALLEIACTAAFPHFSQQGN